MIREDYCSSEVNELLEKKGAFKDIDIRWRFTNCLHRQYVITHQMAMKWLRKKGIFILPDIRIADGKWFCMIARRFEEVDNGCTGERRAMGYYDTYKETVEAALKYVLENLI